MAASVLLIIGAYLFGSIPVLYWIGKKRGYDLREALGLSATVRLPEFSLGWEARFARMSDTIDPQTRTVGVIVEVDDPYEGVRPGVRPPLVKEMFVEVEISVQVGISDIRRKNMQ